jgi:hypothetical protein
MRPTLLATLSACAAGGGIAIYTTTASSADPPDARCVSPDSNIAPCFPPSPTPSRGSVRRDPDTELPAFAQPTVPLGLSWD